MMYSFFSLFVIIKVSTGSPGLSRPMNVTKNADPLRELLLAAGEVIFFFEFFFVKDCNSFIYYKKQ